MELKPAMLTMLPLSVMSLPLRSNPPVVKEIDNEVKLIKLLIVFWLAGNPKVKLAVELFVGAVPIQLPASPNCLRLGRSTSLVRSGPTGN